MKDQQRKEKDILKRWKEHVVKKDEVKEPVASQATEVDPKTTPEE